MNTKKIQYFIVFGAVCVLGLSFLLQNSLKGTVVQALGNWPDERFASAGPAHQSLGDLYTYTWDSMSDQFPPDQPAAYPNHAFLRIVGKLDNRHDGLSCNPCTQANIDAIFAAEQPKIQDLLSRDINKRGVWVVGNEANFNPQIPAELHAYQFKKYRDLIRSLDSLAQLGNSGLLGIGWPGVSQTLVLPAVAYMDTFLANLNSADWPDIYNLHFYPSGTDPNFYANNVQQARDFRALMNSKGESAKPLWVTEFGMNVNASQADTNAYMDTMTNAFIGEHLAQRWFWFIGTFEPSFVEVTALTKDGVPTATGLHYQQLAQEAASAPLTISNVSVSGITTNSAIVEWDTSNAGTSWVTYGARATSLTSSTPEDTNPVLHHAVVLSGLKKNTHYYYQVHSRNGQGSVFSSPTARFRTKAR